MSSFCFFFPKWQGADLLQKWHQRKTKKWAKIETKKKMTVTLNTFFLCLRSFDAQRKRGKREIFKSFRDRTFSLQRAYI